MDITMCSILKSDWLYSFLAEDGVALYSQQKQDQELTVAQFMDYLLQRHYFSCKGPYNQRYGFSSSHLWMLELDDKKSWVPKNWCFQTVVLEKTPESPLDCKEIKPVSPKGNQPWIFIGKIDAEAAAPILWPPDVKSWLMGKDPETGRDWGQEEKGMTEDGMVGWHHRLDGHELE